MAYQDNIRPSINYTFQIYPFADPARTQTVILFNSITSTSIVPITLVTLNNYLIESFSFNNDVFNPIQTGTARVAQLDYDQITFFKYVREGDLLFIQEDGNNIFSGYIESMQLDITNNGSVITINFVNFLKQLSIAKVFGQIFQTLQPSQGVLFQDLLDTITGNTLIGPALDKVSLFTFELYKGIGEPASAPNLVLKDSNKVYVTISSFMTILQAINKIIYPYQRLIYQDAIGNIAIAPLSLFDDTKWFFTQYNTPITGIPYTSLSIKKSAAAVPNLEYATLFTIPTAQGILGGNQSQLNSDFFCQYSPPAKYFSRANQLYNSGNFFIPDVIIEDIIADPSKIDITLNNISEALQGSGSISKSAAITIASINNTPKSQQPLISQGGVDVSAILFNYAARTMAEHLVDETQVVLTSPRISQVDLSGNLLPLPINRLVDLDLDPGILETSSLFCRGYSFSYSSESGTNVTLNLCKPLVGGAYWVNGALTLV